MQQKKLIGQGRTSEIYQWSQGKILKLFRTGIPIHMIENEYKISLEINKTMKFTPKVYELISLDNRKGIIYEEINGFTMMKRIASKPWLVKKEAQRLAELHKLIQEKVDFELPNYKTKLKNDISRTELLSDNIKIRLFKYIEELEDNNILCHGDFHPDNILITKDQPIIIDWMTASKGNPLADIARTIVLFKFAVIPEKSFIEKKIIDFIRKRLFEEYIKHYIHISEVKFENIEKWELPVAAARLSEWIPVKEKEALLNFINLKIEKIK